MSTAIVNVQYFQIPMSVPVTMVVVHKSVTTLLVATHVDVTLDMSWMDIVKVWIMFLNALDMLFVHPPMTRCG